MNWASLPSSLESDLTTTKICGRCSLSPITGISRPRIFTYEEDGKTTKKNCDACYGRDKKYQDANKAKVKFNASNFEIIEQGDYVICAVTSRKIPVQALRYWSVDRQEAYAVKPPSAAVAPLTSTAGKPRMQDPQPDRNTPQAGFHVRWRTCAASCAASCAVRRRMKNE